jgi:hypothetical protein
VSFPRAAGAFEKKKGFHAKPQRREEGVACLTLPHFIASRELNALSGTSSLRVFAALRETPFFSTEIAR